MSKIEVDAITEQSGTTLTTGGGAGKTVVVDATTVTLGRCGGTVALASGATQSGFGRTGTVDWQTSIKTAASFTAVNGEGYFVDTSSNAITANLPAGSAGAIVSFKDYAQNFDTNALTIAANGSEKIEGLTDDLTLTTEGLAVTLVYGDATKGWQAVNSNEITNVVQYVGATGGTVTTVCTNFKVHTFTGPGTFTVTCAGSAGGSNTVDYLVVAGGGGGGGGEGTGAGGAGGYRESPGAASGCYSVSPLGTSPAVALPVSVQAYPVVVGGGGPGATDTNPVVGINGVNSSFSSITSAGGGGGGGGGGSSVPCGTGANGGSGGGGGGRNSMAGGSGNSPPTNPAQGTDGGTATSGTGPSNDSGGGGGGATTVGIAGASCGPGGNGGAGATSSINATPTTRAGGGGGASQAGSAGTGGPGGGGAGGNSSGGSATAGTDNTGGGGGAKGYPSGSGANGGSGIVIIRYKFQ